MKKIPLAGAVALACAFCASASYADNVKISTYYPSPYGSYRNLDTSQDTHLATAGGSVGIGTTNPTAPLHVLAPSNQGILVENALDFTPFLSFKSAGVLRGQLGSDSVRLLRFFNAANTELFVIDNSGNVGVGTSTPGAKLHVNGDIRLTQGGNTGNLKVAYDAGTAAYYATYAP